MSKAEYILAVCIMTVVLQGAAVMVETAQVHSIGRMSLAVTAPYRDGTAHGHRKAMRCSHLYNVGRHTEWASCMGVGYK